MIGEIGNCEDDRAIGIGNFGVYFDGFKFWFCNENNRDSFCTELSRCIVEC